MVGTRCFPNPPILFLFWYLFGPSNRVEPASKKAELRATGLRVHTFPHHSPIYKPAPPLSPLFNPLHLHHHHHSLNSDFLLPNNNPPHYYWLSHPPPLHRHPSSLQPCLSVNSKFPKTLFYKQALTIPPLFLIWNCVLHRSSHTLHPPHFVSSDNSLHWSNLHTLTYHTHLIHIIQHAISPFYSLSMLLLFFT